MNQWIPVGHPPAFWRTLHLLRVINRHIGLLGNWVGNRRAEGIHRRNSSVSSVIVDPQGDLSQFILGVDEEGVAAGGGDLERAKIFGENTEVRVWTPVRSKGLPLCLNPFVAPSDSLDEEQLISSWDLMAAGFTSIAGFNLAKPEGAEIKAYLVSLIELADKGNVWPKNFHQLADYVESPDRLDNSRDLTKVCLIHASPTSSRIRAETNLPDVFVAKKPASTISCLRWGRRWTLTRWLLHVRLGRRRSTSFTSTP